MKENETTSTTVISTDFIEPQTQDVLEEKPKQLTVSKNYEIILDLQKIRIGYDNIITILNNLNLFEYKLKSLEDINTILTTDVLLILQKLAELNNIQINLVLYRIYLNLITKQSLYNKYLSLSNNYIEVLDKISLLLYLIDECVLLIERLDGFVYDPNFYIFKKKTLQLIKFLYSNVKNKIQDEDKLEKLSELINTLPPKFFSKSYNEFSQNKDLFNVFKSLNTEKISTFEDKFLDANNYFEQYDLFKEFVELNCDIDYNNSQNDDLSSETKNISLNINIINNEKNIDFLFNFGLLVLKFCKYHHYIFLNKEESEEEKKEIAELEKGLGENLEKTKVVFLLDKFKIVTPNNYNMPGYTPTINVADVLQNKQFISVVDTDQYIYLIKNLINFYLENTKNLENHPKLKNIREQMIYYASTLDTNSYVPLYLKKFNNINICDNFGPGFSINVPAGKQHKIYLETKHNEQFLVMIEFVVEDKTKDITFQVNLHDIYTDTFKPIFQQENIQNTFKLYIFCNGYSLYEIIFNNDYSWFNSKDISYRISLLKHSNYSKTLKPCEFLCNLNGKSFLLNSEEIIKRIGNKEHEKYININVIMYLNNLRIITIEKNEKGQDDITLKEIIEQEEKYIPKHLFDYSLINHLLKLKIDPNEKKKIRITIFSQNRGLGTIVPNIEEKLKTAKNQKNKEFLEKIGFIPTESLGEYKVEYKLYDLCEQILVYHLFLCNNKKMQISKNILLLNFDKLVINYAIFQEGKISTHLKQQIENNELNNNEESILNFIKSVKEMYGEISLVLCNIDYKDEEKKKQLSELIEKIKKYCAEDLQPNVPIVIYEADAISINAFKYMNLFYNN